MPWSAVAILIIGVTFSVGLYLMLARQAADAETNADDELPAPPRGRRGVGFDRPLHDRRAHRPGRHGRDLRRGDHGRRQLPPPGGDQAPAARADRRPNAVAQFCDEANLLAALHHPNIVAVHDFGRSQDQYFLAEEYVFGRDLGRLVARRFARGARSRCPSRSSPTSAASCSRRSSTRTA